MRKLFASAALIMGISSAALAVSITFDPADFGYTSNGTYVLNRPVGGLGNTIGLQTFDATTGASDWYSLYVQPGYVGQFRVVDAGGGVYNLVTRNSSTDATAAAGLTSSGFGGTGPSRSSLPRSP